MIKSIGKLTLAAILAALVMGVPLHASADPATTPTAPASPTAKAAVYKGKVGAVDKTNKTITVENKTIPQRIIAITSETKITKAGKPATLEDAMVGDEVGGQYVKSDDGKMTAKTVRLTAPKTAAAAPAAPAAPAK